MAVISAVNCSASTSRTVAEHFRDDEWRREFPNVDGVFAPLGPDAVLFTVSQGTAADGLYVYAGALLEN